VNTTLLLDPGGPYPPAVMLVQLNELDQLSVGAPFVHTSMPGAEEMVVTTTATVAVLAKPALVAVSVIGYEPGERVFRLVTLRMEMPGPVIIGGLKFAPRPSGKLLKENATVPENPLVAVTVAVKFVPEPAKMLCEAGDAERANTLTMALNARLLVHVPSVTERVMSELPVCPAVGVTVSVRLVPLPPRSRFAFGIND